MVAPEKTSTADHQAHLMSLYRAWGEANRSREPILVDRGPPYFVFIDDYEGNRKLFVDMVTDKFGCSAMATAWEDIAYDFILKHASEICAVHAPATVPETDLISSLLHINRVKLPLGTGSSAVRFYMAVVDRYVPESSMVLLEAGAGRQEVDIWLEWQKVDPRFEHIAKPISISHFYEVAARILARWQERASASISSDVALVSAPSTELAIACGRVPDFLDRITPRQFEEMVGAIFRNHGFEVELTAKTCDGGYDLMVTSNPRLQDGIAVVEVKHYRRDRPVGVDFVRQIYGVKSLQRADKCYLVTSSSVSDYAKREFSRVIPRELEFIERHDILDWCRRHYPKLLTNS